MDTAVKPVADNPFALTDAVADPNLAAAVLDPALADQTDPVLIGVYAGGFLIALLWNLFAYYYLVTMQHYKRERAIRFAGGSERNHSQFEFHVNDDDTSITTGRGADESA